MTREIDIELAPRVGTAEVRTACAHGLSGTWSLRARQLTTGDLELRGLRAGGRWTTSMTYSGAARREGRRVRVSGVVRAVPVLAWTEVFTAGLAGVAGLALLAVTRSPAALILVLVAIVLAALARASFAALPTEEAAAARELADALLADTRTSPRSR